jgi:predicted nucleotidyltransferase
VFTINDRDRVRDHVLTMATSDARIAAGAVVGSLARGDGDRWSDLDLTFAVVDTVPLGEVLEAFTRELAGQFDAVQLFDLPSGAAIYRVFLLPGCLQFDLSFAPASNFGAVGPEFRLLFGQAVEKSHLSPPPAHQLFGYGVHHALRARFCIERGRYWQAEYWISAVRDYALSLACRRHGLRTDYGRGFDDLPALVRLQSLAALIVSLDRDELLRALGRAIQLLLSEADDVRELATRVEPQLRTLTDPWPR